MSGRSLLTCRKVVVEWLIVVSDHRKKRVTITFLEKTSSVPARTHTATVGSSGAANPRVPLPKSRVVSLSPILAGRDVTASISMPTNPSRAARADRIQARGLRHRVKHKGLPTPNCLRMIYFVRTLLHLSAIPPFAAYLQRRHGATAIPQLIRTIRWPSPQ
jgi:hypothetical protein